MLVDVAFRHQMKMDCYLHVVDVAEKMEVVRLVLQQLVQPVQQVLLVALVVLQLISLLPLVIQEVDPQLTKTFVRELFSQQLSLLVLSSP